MIKKFRHGRIIKDCFLGCGDELIKAGTEIGIGCVRDGECLVMRIPRNKNGQQLESRWGQSVYHHGGIVSWNNVEPI